MSIRRVAGVWAVSLVFGAGCALLPDEVADPARAVGVRVALQVHQSSLRVVAEQRATQLPSCRPPLPAGPVTVTTRLRWVQKSPGVRATIVREETVFRRDQEGNLALSQRLRFPLPDGRETERTTERRHVEGVSYVAVDGRFAEAARLPEVAADIRAGAQGEVDALLSMVRIGRGGRLVAADGDGLCRAPALAAPDAIDAALARWGVRGRSGWLQWRDRAARMVMTVTYDEHIEPVAEPVAAPDTVWPIDPDRSWFETTRFVDGGLAEGWLGPSRMVQPAPPLAGGGGAADEP